MTETLANLGEFAFNIFATYSHSIKAAAQLHSLATAAQSHLIQTAAQFQLQQLGTDLNYYYYLSKEINFCFPMRTISFVSVHDYFEETFFIEFTYWFITMVNI